jgi:membrane protein YqaA with SNARE-associated domain
MNAGQETPPQQTWRKRALAIGVVAGSLGISVGLFFFTRAYPDTIDKFGSYGYLGVFIASLVSSATVILPVPGVLVLLPVVVTLNPLLVALAGSAGGIIGETTGYIAGFGGQAMVSKGKFYARVEGWMKRWGAWTIFVFAFAPFLLFDVAGVVAGALRYPFWKFMLIGFVGKTLKYIGLVYAAILGYNWLLHYFGA